MSSLTLFRCGTSVTSSSFASMTSPSSLHYDITQFVPQGCHSACSPPVPVFLVHSKRNCSFPRTLLGCTPAPTPFRQLQPGSSGPEILTFSEGPRPPLCRHSRTRNHLGVERRGCQTPLSPNPRDVGGLRTPALERSSLSLNHGARGWGPGKEHSIILLRASGSERSPRWFGFWEVLLAL